MFPRALDLLTEGDAALFLAPFGLAARAAELPLPCRAVWLPGTRSGLSGLTVFPTDGGTLLAGPVPRLRATADDLLREVLDRYDRPAASLRFRDGSAWDFGARACVMGILNVTPDSFSDGGRFADEARAVAHAVAMFEEGADIVDVGGESTRPGAAPVPPAEEARRVVPVIAALRRERPADRISIDTRRAEVARAAIGAGADLVNDVSALGDPEMPHLVAAAGVPIALMHMRGTPETMQRDTRYGDLVGEVAAFLAARAEIARESGIAGDRILVDPGLGFGKSARGNELLLRQLRSLAVLGYPVLLGASRKAFLGRAAGVDEPAARLGASVAAAVLAVREGAAVVRVHDVGATRQALAVLGAVQREAAGGAEGDRRG